MIVSHSIKYHTVRVGLKVLRKLLGRDSQSKYKVSYRTSRFESSQEVAGA